MQGGTFAVSNLGMYGIEDFTSIINPPNGCILSVGQIKQTPVVKNGEIVPGNVMKLSLSCDHRVVDGAVGSDFLKTLKELLENALDAGADQITVEWEEAGRRARGAFLDDFPTFALDGPGFGGIGGPRG